MGWHTDWLRRSSERHADWCLVEPGQALSRDALEIVVALLPRVAEAVRVRGLSRDHVRGPLQGVALFSNPSWLITAIFGGVLVASVRVFEVRIPLQVMLVSVMLFLRGLGISQLGVQQRDFSIVWLQEDRILQVRPHIHRRLIV